MLSNLLLYYILYCSTYFTFWKMNQNTQLKILSFIQIYLNRLHFQKHNHECITNVLIKRLTFLQSKEHK